MAETLRTMPRPYAERIARLEQRHDNTDKRVDGIDAKMTVVHEFVLTMKGGRAAILLIITVGGSLAGIAAGVVTVARILLHI